MEVELWEDGDVAEQEEDGDNVAVKGSVQGVGHGQGPRPLPPYGPQAGDGAPQLPSHPHWVEDDEE